MLRLYFISCRTTSGVPNIMGWPTTRSKLSVKSVGLPVARGQLVCEFRPAYINAISISFSKKAGEIKTSQSQYVLDWQSFASVNVLLWLSSTPAHIEFLWIQALSYDMFYAPKGRHIVIKLPVLSVLSVWVFISYPEYISYIILGRNAKIRDLMHLGSWSVTHLYHCHQI